MLNTDDGYVLIVGGGSVGLRKAKKLIEAGCHVTVVSEKFDDGFKGLGASLIERRIAGPADISNLLSDCSMAVIAVGDPRLSESIARYCRENRILYNRVDAINSQVIFPAFSRSGELILSVSTSGASPSMAKYVLRQISRNMELYARAVEILGIFRKRLGDMAQDEKRDLFESILDDETFWQTVETGSSLDVLMYLDKMISRGGSNGHVGGEGYEAEAQQACSGQDIAATR